MNNLVNVSPNIVSHIVWAILFGNIFFAVIWIWIRNRKVICKSKIILLSLLCATQFLKKICVIATDRMLMSSNIDNFIAFKFSYAVTTIFDFLIIALIIAIFVLWLKTVVTKGRAV